LTIVDLIVLENQHRKMHIEQVAELR